MPKPGFISPSSFADLMTNGRGSCEMGKTALNVVELLTLDMLGVERREAGATPPSCQWGIDHEYEAIQAYEERTFREVKCPVEFRASRTHSYVGGTMDGLIGSVGGVKIKCPYNSSEHLDNNREGKQLYNQYMFQVQGYIWIYELSWIDFVSYDPRFPAPSDLVIYRVEPDAVIIKALQQRCELAYRMACENVRLINAKGA